MKKKILSIIIFIVLLTALAGCSKNNNPSEYIAPTVADSNTETKKPTEKATEKPTVVPTQPEPIIEASYTIDEAISDFHGDRAWVSYKKGNESYYALIDHNGYIIWSIEGNQIDKLHCGGLSTDDNTYCIYTDNNYNPYHYSYGMIIIDSEGKIKFDSRDANEDESYYYLGYGDGTYLAVKWVKNFSENNYYIIEIDKSGNITNESEWPDYWDGHESDNDIGIVSDIYHINQGFIYHGNDLFSGIQSYTPWGGPVWFYDKKNHNFYCSNKKFSEMLSITEIISDSETLFQYNKPSLKGYGLTDDYYLMDTEILYSQTEKIDADGNGKSFFGGHYGEKLFNCTKSNQMKKFAAGVYDYKGNLISAYPEDWSITGGDSFSGGYAPLTLKGADKETYLVLVDSNGTQMYDPIKIDSVRFPSWHGYVMAEIDGDSVIVSPEGKITDRSELDDLYSDYSIGNISVTNGYEMTYNESTEKNDGYSYADGGSIHAVYQLSNYKEIANWNSSNPTESNTSIAEPTS